MSVTLQCPKHPRYTAKLSPRASCEPCRALYELTLKAIADRLTVKP